VASGQWHAIPTSHLPLPCLPPHPLLSSTGELVYYGILRLSEAIMPCDAGYNLTAKQRTTFDGVTRGSQENGQRPPKTRPQEASYAVPDSASQVVSFFWFNPRSIRRRPIPTATFRRVGVRRELRVRRRANPQPSLLPAPLANDRSALTIFARIRRSALQVS
jgi:hypothetical protein